MKAAAICPQLSFDLTHVTARNCKAASWAAQGNQLLLKHGANPSRLCPCMTLWCSKGLTGYRLGLDHLPYSAFGELISTWQEAVNA